jgi:hypothetical protein
VLSTIVEAADAAMCVRQGQRDVALFAPEVGMYAYPKIVCEAWPRQAEIGI